jgi:hypothetical protein
MTDKIVFLSLDYITLSYLIKKRKIRLHALVDLREIWRVMKDKSNIDLC